MLAGTCQQIFVSSVMDGFTTSAIALHYISATCHAKDACAVWQGPELRMHSQTQICMLSRGRKQSSMGYLQGRVYIDLLVMVSKIARP